MFSTRRATFLVTYEIGDYRYTITLPGVSSSHVRATWDRPGSTLVSVEECDRHGTPL